MAFAIRDIHGYTCMGGLEVLLEPTIVQAMPDMPKQESSSSILQTSNSLSLSLYFLEAGGWVQQFVCALRCAASTPNKPRRLGRV